MKKIVIFDFDGTLADTLRVNLQIIKDLGLNDGQEITEQIIDEFKNAHVSEFLQKHNISRVRLYLYFRKIKSELRERMGEVDIFPGLKEEIGKMHKAGYRLGILSSNDKANIDLFVSIHALTDFFDFVHTEKNIFAKDTKLKSILKTFGLKSEDVIYIGDEVRDIEAAKRAGLKNIAVTWGYNSPKILAAASPNALVKHPKQIIKTLEGLVNER
jgi:phosphoglycolate phosphatase